MNEIGAEIPIRTELPNTRSSSRHGESGKACAEEWLTMTSAKRYDSNANKSRPEINKVVDQRFGEIELFGDSKAEGTDVRHTFSRKTSVRKEVIQGEVELIEGRAGNDLEDKREKGRKDSPEHNASSPRAKEKYTDCKEYWDGGCKVLEGTDKDGTRIITKVDKDGVTVYREERRKDGSFSLRVENPDGSGFYGEKDSSGLTIKHTSWGLSLLGGGWTIVDNPDGSREYTDGSGSTHHVKPGKPIMVI